RTVATSQFDFQGLISGKDFRQVETFNDGGQWINQTVHRTSVGDNVRRIKTCSFDGPRSLCRRTMQQLPLRNLRQNRGGPDHRKSCEVVLASAACSSRSIRSALMLITPSTCCSLPSIIRKGSCVITSRNVSNIGGATTALLTPVSSSRLMNTKPFAVPGRWRQITFPAMRTRLPCFAFGRSAARQI